MADDHFIQNVPVEYMDLQTLWSDRRDPHANPMSSSPRRETARAGASSLGKAIEGVYRPGVGDEGPAYKLADKRLYGDQK
jgi:hypothetical protein